MPMDHAEILQNRPGRTVRTASALVMLFLAWMFLPEKVCLGQTVPPIVVTSRTMLSDNNPIFDRFAKSSSAGVTYNDLSFGMEGTFGSLAVNPAGDLLQGGYNWDAVWDFPANGGTPYKIYTIPDSDHVSAIAADSNGNVVVTSRYGYITTMLPYVNGAYSFYADTLGTTAYTPPLEPTPTLCTGTIANGVVTVTSTSACTYDYPILYWPALSTNGTYLTNGSYIETIAVAFDPQGDSFLADVNDNIGGNNIFECSIECNFGASPPVQILNFVNPTTTVTPGSCFNKASYFDQIAGLAADGSGNVYFTNDTGTIYEVAAGTGSATALPTVFATGFIAAEGISFDSTGNLYVADNGNTSGKFTDYSCVSTGGGGLWEIPLVNGVLNPAKMFMVFPMGTGSASGTNYQNIWGVAVDQHGNIFAQEGYTDLWKFTVGNAPFAPTAVGSGSNPIPLTLTFNAPVTLQSAAITAAGAPSKDFAVVTSGSVNATASLTVPAPTSNFQILPSAISLDLTPGFTATETIGIGQAASYTGGVTLAVSGLPTGVTGTIDPTTNILTLTASSSATPGSASLSVYAPFTATVSGKSVTENESAQILLNVLQPCVFGAVNAAQSSCVIDVQFNPTQSGQRNAILTLTDTAGDNIPVYLTGVGVGQAVTVDPGTQSAVGSGLKAPGAVAVDGAGNVFVADAGANAVYEYAGGVGAGTALGSGLSAPGGVAADSAGNLYISDTGNNRVVEFANTTSGPYSGSQTTILSGLNKPGQLAVDGSGTLYIPEAGNNDVVTYVNRSGLASGGVKTVPVTAAAGLSSPLAVALDAFNNIYVASPASNTIVESSDGSISNVGTNLSVPTGVAVDGSGSVIIANSGSGLIVRVPNQNGGLAASYQSTVTSSILNPYAVALDQSGNLIAADSTNAAAYFLNSLSGYLTSGR